MRGQIGWTKTTVKPGDVITGGGYQLAEGQKIIKLERVMLSDVKELRVYGSQAIESIAEVALLTG